MKGEEGSFDCRYIPGYALRTMGLDTISAALPSHSPSYKHRPQGRASKPGPQAHLPPPSPGGRPRIFPAHPNDWAAARMMLRGLLVPQVAPRTGCVCYGGGGRVGASGAQAQSHAQVAWVEKGSLRPRVAIGRERERERRRILFGLFHERRDEANGESHGTANIWASSFR